VFINHPSKKERMVIKWKNFLTLSILEVLKDMQDYRIISNNTIDEILKNKNNVKEKDDFER